MSRPPTWFTSIRQPMYDMSCPKSPVKSTCVTAKFGSFFDHAEMEEKRQNVISSSISRPISLCFFYHIFTVEINFVYNANAEMCDYSLLHCNFVILKK